MTKKLMVVLLMVLLTSCANRTNYRPDYNEQDYSARTIWDDDSRFDNANYNTVNERYRAAENTIQNCLVIGADGSRSFMNETHSNEMPANHFNTTTWGTMPK